MFRFRCRAKWFSNTYISLLFQILFPYRLLEYWVEFPVCMLIWASWGSEWNLFHLFICTVPKIIFFPLYSLKCWVNDQFSFTVCKMILQRALCLSGTCQEVELHSGGQLHKLSWKNYVLKTKGTREGSWGIVYRQDPWVKRGKRSIATHGAQWELD